MIGQQHPEPHACGDVHLPNCYAPHLNLTACCCGEWWWRGQIGVWRSRQIRETGRATASGRWRAGDVVGYDRYFLHRPDCSDGGDTNPDPTHRCVETVPMTAEQAHRPKADRSAP